MADSSSPPLKGVRVLELARVLAGPWAGQLLADLGADVVKVERAGTGDETREWGPPFVEAVTGPHLGAAYFHACNRGKRCVEADFETDEGRTRVHRLIAHADVVIENFRVGALRKYGLDHETMRAQYPGLIWCAISGFGQDGPSADRAGYDFLIQGMGGLMSITGMPDGPPMKTALPVVDLFAGLYAANGIQAALLRRARTGEGAFIDCALLDTQLAVLGYQALNHVLTGIEPKRLGNAHPNIVPYDVFPAADGDMIVAVGNDGQFAKFCDCLGAPGLADDPRFSRATDRVHHRAELEPALRELTRQFTRADLLPRLATAGVPAGPINSIGEALADPQVQARGMQLKLDNPRAAAGSSPGLRAPLMIDGAPAAAERPAPALGEHTQDVLADAAWGGLA
ncbi:MAG: CoA transferase [Hyphomicrobiales bacterium]|nr:CoA transferase [Hyphomicrobiales bacterium]